MGTIVLQILKIHNGRFLAITTTVGETDSHETLKILTFTRNQPKPLPILQVRTTPQQESSYSLRPVPNSNQRFFMIVLNSSLTLIDTTYNKVHNISKIEDFDHLTPQSFYLL